MRLTPIPPAAIAATLIALPLGGCNGAFLGNIVVLGVSVAIFFGTLSLGRSTVDATRSAADGSQSTSPARGR